MYGWQPYFQEWNTQALVFGSCFVLLNIAIPYNNEKLSFLLHKIWSKCPSAHSILNELLVSPSLNINNSSTYLLIEFNRSLRRSNHNMISFRSIFATAQTIIISIIISGNLIRLRGRWYMVQCLVEQSFY